MVSSGCCGCPALRPAPGPAAETIANPRTPSRAAVRPMSTPKGGFHTRPHSVFHTPDRPAVSAHAIELDTLRQRIAVLKLSDRQSTM